MGVPTEVSGMGIGSEDRDGDAGTGSGVGGGAARAAVPVEVSGIGIGSGEGEGDGGMEGSLGSGVGGGAGRAVSVKTSGIGRVGSGDGDGDGGTEGSLGSGVGRRVGRGLGRVVVLDDGDGIRRGRGGLLIIEFAFVGDCFAGDDLSRGINDPVPVSVGPFTGLRTELFIPFPAPSITALLPCLAKLPNGVRRRLPTAVELLTCPILPDRQVLFKLEDNPFPADRSAVEAVINRDLTGIRVTGVDFPAVSPALTVRSSVSIFRLLFMCKEGPSSEGRFPRPLRSEIC